MVIDGGNSYYRDDVQRAEALAARGVHYLDVGTSGGVFGLERGYCLMIGGEAEVVARLDPLFRALAPGLEAASRTPGRSGDPPPEELGYLHCGPAGAGHFVKMIHNGIEYGIMAAYAEGLNILHKANAGKRAEQASAEAAPLRDPGFYRYDFDVAAVAEVWRRGSVIGSWLLDLTAHALLGTPRWPGSRAGCRTRARAAGRWRRRWRWACPPTCSPPPCTSGSPPAGRRTSPRSCCRPCARSSAVTRSSRPVSDVPEPAIRVGVVDGEAAVTLAAGELEATFLPGLGLLGTSLRHRGEELLALPGGVAGYRDRNVTGLPLLAPWANRLPAWRYRAAGVEVDLDGLDLATDPAGLPIHGTLTANRGWRLERLAAEAGRAVLEAGLDYGALPELLAAFPFPHRLTVTATVRRGDRWRWRPPWRRPATGRCRSPSAGTPTSASPAPRGSSWRLLLADRTHLELDDRGLPTGKAADEPAEADPVGDRTFDDLYALGQRPGRPPARPGGGRPAPAGRLRRGLRPRPGVRPSGGRVRLPGADDRPHRRPGRRHHPPGRPRRQLHRRVHHPGRGRLTYRHSLALTSSAPPCTM